jgi:hypothetical protein
VEDLTMPQRNVPGIVLAILALVICGLSLSGTVFPPYGLADLTRTALSALGVWGAVMFFRKNPVWFTLLGIWATAQFVVLIVDGTGSLTSQSVYLGMTWTEQTTVNGKITSMSGYGFNLVGAILLGLAWFARRTERRVAAGAR